MHHRSDMSVIIIFCMCEPNLVIVWLMYIWVLLTGVSNNSYRLGAVNLCRHWWWLVQWHKFCWLAWKVCFNGINFVNCLEKFVDDPQTEGTPFEIKASYFIKQKPSFSKSIMKYFFLDSVLFSVALIPYVWHFAYERCPLILTVHCHGECQQ